MSNHANRLANEKSPYLLQHARNPVDWHPWGDEAFEKARREDKPVFLSIGYSTCHWCHVMAHESFEDPEVGRLMNEIFVPVKVDREERPDIDAVYMAVCQMLTGSGGWPLTVIMTPGQEPFFAGTYFPRRSRGGRIGMIELAGAIRDAWKNRRHEATAGAGEIVAALRRLSSAPPGGHAGEEEAHRAFTELKERYDPAHGGFGGRPKFPMPGTLLFLFRYWHRNGAREALDMAVSTLEAMRRGGIYDHLGFGFHRYSTDAEWRVPHFEKMLYDQALMAMAYTEAHAITGRQDFRDTAREVLEYVIRDLSSPEGGFHSAEDADSEGVEGKFYLWSPDELSRLLHDGERRVFYRVFGITGEGNYRDEASGGATGLNILHMDGALSAAAEGLSMGVDELGAALSDMKRRLYAFRSARVRPHRDDKVLTDWNGLMIAALAVAARLFGEERYAAAARRAADFILARMRDAGGGLLHRYREGESAIPGNLDDYAFFTWGLLELYGAGFEPAYLEAAVELTGDLIRRFRDEGRGGFYFTPEDGQPLIVRPREIYDGALPSGNAVAMMNLLTLGTLTARTEYVELAHGILQGFADSVRQQPSAHSFLMGAMLLALGRSTQIVIVGERDAPDTRRMIDETRRGYRPGAVTMLLTPGNRERMNGIAPFTRSFPDGGAKTVAYVCTDHACSEPTRDLAGSLSRLGLA